MDYYHSPYPDESPDTSLAHTFYASLQPQTRKAAACIHPHMPNNILEILLLLEKHSETDDGAIGQKSSNDRHNHGGYLNQTGVSQQSWKSWVLENLISAVRAKSLHKSKM